jgi:hypothetical protein
MMRRPAVGSVRVGTESAADVETAESGLGRVDHAEMTQKTLYFFKP